MSAWEQFIRHPPIDVMALWARTVGLRLIVDLDDADGRRVPVLLRTDTAELARAIDTLPESDREVIRAMVARMDR